MNLIGFPVCIALKVTDILASCTGWSAAKIREKHKSGFHSCNGEKNTFESVTDSRGEAASQPALLCVPRQCFFQLGGESLFEGYNAVISVICHYTGDGTMSVVVVRWKGSCRAIDGMIVWPPMPMVPAAAILTSKVSFHLGLMGTSCIWRHGDSCMES